MIETSTIYDYPSYYDLIFGSDWKPERDFLIQCFEKYVARGASRLFEPACGTGRLMFRLAKSGYDMIGLDLNHRAVQYCNRRLKRHGFPESAFVADMTDFRLTPKADAAFNTINSFRHLQTERAAQDHLRCMARAIRKGGIYVLGLHLSPLVGIPCEEEQWSARRGHLCVNTHMWLLERQVKKRLELYGMTYDVFTPTRQFQLVNEVTFRTYTYRQFARLIESVSEWEIAATYDFAYEIDYPIEINKSTEDVVYVLQRV